MTRKYIAAAVQLHADADGAANLNKAEESIRTAAGHGAQLVVLPEVFLWRGLQAEEVTIAQSIPGPNTERLAATARACGVHVLAGSLHESAGEKVYNTSVLFGPTGEILAQYRKIHLFDVDIAGHVSVRESDSRRPGDTPVAVDTALGRLGLSVCYDLRFPELYRKLVLGGARVLLVPAAFTFATGSAHWEVLLRARAIENQAYVIAANQIGAGPAGIRDYGNSMVVDPWGRVTARASDRETIIYAEIDYEFQDEIRRQLPCLEHVRLR